jgi:hypothetical protein
MRVRRGGADEFLNPPLRRIQWWHLGPPRSGRVSLHLLRTSAVVAAGHGCHRASVNSCNQP